ncbi:MAG: hypothetical protein CMF11_06595 [Idiomarina sp.]|nr:hypothetical protein [Idiomarina sp.]
MPKGIPRLTSLNTGLGIDFSDNLKMQNGIINNRGQVVIHEIGVSCTCRKSGLFDKVVAGTSFCSRCDNGWLYRKPRKIMSMFSSTSFQNRMAVEGLLTPGDTVISVAPNLKNPPSQYDRITWTWPENVGDGQIIIRGLEAETRSDLEADEDYLYYSPASAIYVEDEDGVEYQEDTDFIFTGKKIKWMNGPEVRKRYTIKYNAYLSWIVWNPPATRRDRNRSLGSRIILRKSHIVNYRDEIDTTIVESQQFTPNAKV